LTVDDPCIFKSTKENYFMQHHLDAIIKEPNKPAQSCVIWLHGLGADGHDFVEIIPALQLPDDLAVRFIFPHAPIMPVTLNNGIHMRAWFDIVALSLDAPLDVAGIQASQLAIHTLIDQQRQQGIAADKIILAGFSQGGALALAAGLGYVKPLAGLIGLSTFLPDSAQFAAHPLHQPKHLPILLAHGTFDAIVPIQAGLHTRDLLLNEGYQVGWHTYPIQHEVCMDEIKTITAWLINCLK